MVSLSVLDLSSHDQSSKYLVTSLLLQIDTPHHRVPSLQALECHQRTWTPRHQFTPPCSQQILTHSSSSLVFFYILSF